MLTIEPEVSGPGEEIPPADVSAILAEGHGEIFGWKVGRGDWVKERGQTIAIVRAIEHEAMIRVVLCGHWRELRAPRWR